MVANNEDCNDDKLLINIRSSWHVRYVRQLSGIFWKCQ